MPGTDPASATSVTRMEYPGFQLNVFAETANVSPSDSKIAWCCRHVQRAACLRDDRQQILPVLVIDKDVFASVTTGGDVIDGAGEFDTQWPSHGGRLRPEGAKDKA